MTKKKTPNGPTAILAKVLKAHADEGKANYLVASAETDVLRLNATPDEPTLIYQQGVARGYVAATFSTRGFAEWWLTRCGELVDEYLHTAEAPLKAGGTAKIAPAFGPRAKRAITEYAATFIINNFILALQYALNAAVDEQKRDLELLAMAAARRLVRDALAGLPLSEPSDLRREAERLAGASRSERRSLLLGSLDRIEGKPDFSRLTEHHRFLSGKYQEAKDSYKRNKKSPKWIDHIRLDVEGVEFPDDLLLHMAGLDGELPEAVRTAIANNNLGASPGDVAAEHAARLCGARPNSIPRSTLFARLKKGPEDKSEQIEGIH
jgi:hypothetical protein